MEFYSITYMKVIELSFVLNLLRSLSVTLLIKMLISTARVADISS